MARSPGFQWINMNAYIKEYIMLWGLNSQKKSIPIPYSRLTTDLERISPEFTGQDVLNFLRSENLVCANIHGEYILTEKGLSVRKLYPSATQSLSAQPEPPSPYEYSRFRRLLSYYIDCISLTEHAQEYLFDNQSNSKFFVPILPYDWLQGLENCSSNEISITIPTMAKVAFMQLLQRSDEDEEIYLGYPVEVFKTKNGNCCYAPIGLIPIDIVRSTETTLDVNLRFDEAELNQNWLEFSVPDGSRDYIVKALLNNKINNGLLDLKSAIPVISQFAKGLQSEIDPTRCDNFLPVDIKEKKETYNVPVMFVGNGLKYAKTLKKELIYIRDKVSDKDLDSTAIAYVFREHPLTVLDTHEYAPLPFIDSNDEQRHVLYDALNLPISKVTGPPGTGKTQVAVNIISNLVYNGKTVLFTSMNHKAVHAIEERSLGLLKSSGLNLINFCSNADNSVQNYWYKQNLDLLIGKGLAAYVDNGDIDVRAVADASKNWLRIAKYYEERETFIQKSGKCVKNLNRIICNLKRLLRRNNFERNNYDIKKIKKCIYKINKKEEFRFGNIFRFMYWYILRRKSSKKALSYINDTLPSFANYLSIDNLKNDLKNFIGALSEYDNTKRDFDDIRIESKKIPSLESGIRELDYYIDDINKHLISSLTYKLANTIKSLSLNGKELNEIKGIMVMLKNAKSPYFFQRLSKVQYDDAQRGFCKFSHYFPGWAATLLSLSKASPCIPGLFDKVIIDEASQVEIPPIIPALFRAKTVTVVGDPNQFPPVKTMKEARHNYLKSKHGLTDIEDQAYDFMTYSAYDIIRTSPTMLKEHFRCSSDIADFFNSEFYNNNLRVMTNPSKLNFPNALGYKHAIEWIDIKNNLDSEFNSILSRIKDLIKVNYSGSVGIISPLKKHANALKELTYKYKTKLNDFQVNTVNAFQGGERDLIIFALGYTNALSKGERWYIESTENRYIFNVATSRARACLLIVGDRQACLNSGVEVLHNLALYPKDKPYNTSDDYVRFESPVEQKLYNALLTAGIKTSPQYPLVGRRLDLALVDYKIDIEIDGKQWHLNSEGSRKLDDVYRDLQLQGVGWQVIRFWATDVINDIENCVKKVKAVMDDNG